MGLNGAKQWVGNGAWFRKVESLAHPTLWPHGLYPPGSSNHEIFQARVLEWVAIAFSRGSSRPRDRTWVSRIVGRHLRLWRCGQFYQWGKCFSKASTPHFYHPLCRHVDDPTVRVSMIKHKEHWRSTRLEFLSENLVSKTNGEKCILCLPACLSPSGWPASSKRATEENKKEGKKIISNHIPTCPWLPWKDDLNGSGQSFSLKYLSME